MSVAPASRWSKSSLLAVAIITFAAAARLTHVAWDQNHFFHPDERAVAGAVMRLSFRPLQLNPQFFAYGSLPIYLAKISGSLLSYVDPHAVSYDGVIVNGRAMSGVIGTLTVLVLIMLGTRLYDRTVGLLAGILLAACALHIQNSRFLTVDVTLTFFVLLALSQMVRASLDGQATEFVFSGIAIGLATASKFSAMPLFLPLAIAALHRCVVERRFTSVAARLLMAVLAAVCTFALAQPYALLDFHAFFHDIIEQSTMVRTAGVFPYTVQYMGTVKYWYDLEQLVIWGMAPALGVVAVWATATRIGVAWRTRRAEEWILLSWVLPFFLITGWFEVKFPRYLLPIYPIMILWAAAVLVRWSRSGRVLGRLAAPVVVAVTLAAAFAFMSTYTRPHSIVTASEWTYRHLPAGSKILSQHWDEGFPFSLPGHSANSYQVSEFGYYEPDNPAKIQKLAQELAQSDYIAFQTKRLYGAVTRAPQRFPLTSNYFYELFAGDLGYTLVQEIASRPSLFGIEFPDELGDESLTVYDHPKVLIFQNTGHLDAATIADKILRGLPSRSLTRDDLLAARPAGEAPLEASGAAPPVRSSALALILFIVLVEGLTLSVYALVRRWLPWPGTLAFSKTFGILLFAYVSWLLISLGVATFTQGRLAAIAVAFGVVGTMLWRRGVHQPQQRAEIVATEVLFWGTFMFFLAVRAFNPEVFWGEKPMDFSFLNALTRATTLPPPEPWFAGSPLQYNYFGHYIVAALGKTLHLDPAITFNLGIALFGGLAAAAAFAAGSAITFRWRTGLLAAFLVTLIGNLAGVREATSGVHRTYNFDYFWATSRVIKDTINEFPLWSFLFADLHAHVMVIPVSLSFICLAVLWVRARVMAPGDALPPGARPVLLALLCLFLGAIMVTNTWSTPTYVLFLPFLLGALWLTEGDFRSTFGFLWGVINRVVLLTALIVVGAYVLFLPFWSQFVPPERNFGWERGTLAPPHDFLLIFGLFLFVLVPFLYAIWARNMRRDNQPLGASRGLLLILAVAIALASLGVSTRAFCAILFLLGLQLLLAPQTESRWRIPLTMATFAFAVTAGCDLVYVWDRMNTIFKFYLEAWSMLALAAAVGAGELWSGRLPLPGSAGAFRRAWQVGFIGVIAVGLFTASTDVWGVIHTNRVQTPKPTLDGMAYLRNKSPDELAAYEWLNSNIKGIPIILEATGDGYQEFTRVAMNTGLPTVLGWGYHVFQRGHSWPEINKRKADIETVYTGSDKQAVASILQRYHIAMVLVGGVERRVYSGGNLARFQEWTDLLTPIYQNPGVTIFAVNGRFAGAMPVTTIEDIAALSPEEAPRQEAEERSAQFAPGKVHQPRGVAVRADGDIFVADFGNNRVQEFHKDLSPGLAWGTRGEGPGQFKDPCGIAIGPSGEVFVADTWNQRVQVFNKEGKYQREWGGAFFGPRGIATDAKGAVFVADTGNGRVVRFSATGQREVEWGGKGKAPGQFFEPSGLAADANGKVYVSDNGNGRLQIFTRDGQFVSEFPVSGWESKVYSEPNVSVEPGGTIWVTVPGDKEIRGYDSAGKLLRTITGKSVPGAAFETPMGAVYSAADKGLIVTDLENRVLRVPLTEK